MPGDDPEEADHQRDRRARAATHARVHKRRQRERCQRNQPADQVIAADVPGWAAERVVDQCRAITPTAP